MNNLAVLGISGGVFLIIIFAVIFFALKGGSDKEKIKVKKINHKNPTSSKALDIGDIITQAKKASSHSELVKLAKMFLETEVLPAKTTAKLSDETNYKLSFISAICANKNADAKLIAQLVRELEKRYPSYTQEIEMYQNMGLAKRKMRR